MVSDAPADLRAKRRDVVAHQGVLERLLADGAALPMRFGLVGPDDEQVRRPRWRNRATPTPSASQSRTAASSTTSRSHATRTTCCGRSSTESAEVRRLNERTRQNPDAHDDKVALGELISHEVQARQDRGAYGHRRPF